MHHSHITPTGTGDTSSEDEFRANSPHTPASIHAISDDEELGNDMALAHCIIIKVINEGWTEAPPNPNRSYLLPDTWQLWWIFHLHCHNTPAIFSFGDIGVTVLDTPLGLGMANLSVLTCRPSPPDIIL